MNHKFELWIDMERALQTLPENTRFKGSIEIEPGNPEADRETRHPAICRHPETGETSLFINPNYTTRIDDLSSQQSEQLLTELYQHCTRPEFSCRFNGRPAASPCGITVTPCTRL
jgi:alpha-ketoglutarate-dependent taurine dioxygenase